MGYHILLQVQVKNAKAIESKLIPHVHKVLDADIYNQLTRNLGVHQLGPTPDHPDFTRTNTPANQEVATLCWHVDDDMNSVFLASINEKYKKSTILGMKKMTFIELFAPFKQKYRKKSMLILCKHKDNMVQEWDPKTPINLLFCQINDC